MRQASRGDAGAERLPWPSCDGSRRVNGTFDGSLSKTADSGAPPGVEASSTHSIASGELRVRAVNRSHHLHRRRDSSTSIRWRTADVLMDGRRWPVAEVDDVADLGALLGFDPIQLRRFADVGSFERTARREPMRNYRYRWIAKRSGGVRLIEAPKPILRHAQRTLLRTVLAPIRPHPAAHGFVAGRSVLTAAQPHVGAGVVIRLDLAAFFASVPVGRVFATLTAAGYHRSVAHLMVGLFTNRVPSEVLTDAPAPPERGVARLLRQVHLPQGAPTSPAAANLSAYGLDRRLTALATRFDASYTRYADDLTISGGDELGRSVSRFLPMAQTVVADEGFRLNDAKTRVVRASGRQRVLGIVVNERTNPERREFDRLRAELHEARTKGPDIANRRGAVAYRQHLLGRIEWVRQLNPSKADRLAASFDRIEWN